MSACNGVKSDCPTCLGNGNGNRLGVAGGNHKGGKGKAGHFSWHVGRGNQRTPAAAGIQPSLQCHHHNGGGVGWKVGKKKPTHAGVGGPWGGGIKAMWVGLTCPQSCPTIMAQGGHKVLGAGWGLSAWLPLWFKKRTMGKGSQ